MNNHQPVNQIDPVRIEIYKYLFSAIADEMGIVLRKSSFSPNIKERRDFSCAVFNNKGQMIAQAAHIPVHLGSMPLSVSAAIAKFNEQNSPMEPGDIIILNDPYLGGTHLPDITLISPVFIEIPNFTASKAARIKKITRKTPFAYVASRAHHADVGGISPGSMPIATEIYQEGLIIPPIKLMNAGMINQDIFDLILANVRTPVERAGDLQAQIGANQRGINLFEELLTRYEAKEVNFYMGELLRYTERLMRKLLSTIPEGKYTFEDFLDNNGITSDLIPIRVAISINNDSAIIDFSGSAPQQEGSVNAVYAITLSAVQYVFQSLLEIDAPNNSGSMVPITVIAPSGSVVNAVRPAPVAGGNVETSQRLVDVLLGALSKACPERIPAASQGTMNNLTIGGWDPYRKRYFTYYETIGGGTGATYENNGTSAIHSHMTNTLNTPIEALEYAYPLRVRRYEIRKSSGGEGTHTGGDGIIREIELLSDAQVTLLTERRITSPYGLAGGEPGKSGENLLIHGEDEELLPGKGTIHVNKGEIISVRTPGGGGYGKKVSD